MAEEERGTIKVNNDPIQTDSRDIKRATYTPALAAGEARYEAKGSEGLPLRS